MYDQQDDPLMRADEDEEIQNQEETWTVISSFFEQKGLVRQQLDSFDEFIQNTMQEIIGENDKKAHITLVPELQHHPGQPITDLKRYEINFEQIYLSKPTVTEADNTTQSMLPNEARLRNLT